jgi:putative hydrolase of HD superfamily
MKDSLIKIMNLVNDFKRIERTVYVAKTEPKRFENDAEHSYELAMVAWYLNTCFSLGLDTNLLFKYALIHDLVETKTGDFDGFIYFDDKDFQQKKRDGEIKAIKLLKDEFTDFPEMNLAIEEYESTINQEARFIYALDKLIAQVGVVEIDKRTFADCGISYSSAKEIWDEKISKHSFIYELLQEFISEWTSKSNYFADQDYIPEYKTQRSIPKNTITNN